MRLNKTEQIVFDAMKRLNMWSTVKQITSESQSERPSIQHQSVRRALRTLESFELIKRQDDPEYPSGWRKLYKVKDSL